MYLGLVGMVLLAALVVRDKGGEQHMGEKGKDGEVALCLLDGVDGDSPLAIYVPVVLGDSVYLGWALLCVIFSL